MKNLFFVVCLIFLYGCTEISVSDKNEVVKDIYQGDLLQVGVVGSDFLPIVDHIQYEYVELSDLDGRKEKFDVLIITSEAFIEADKNIYTSFFEKVEYPVFFFGMENFKMFAFTHKDMNIENSKDGNVAYVEGFKNVDGKKEVIKFYKSEESNSDIDFLIRIFNSL